MSDPKNRMALFHHATQTAGEKTGEPRCPESTAVKVRCAALGTERIAAGM
jgi:hypothetical protein